MYNCMENQLKKVNDLLFGQNNIINKCDFTWFQLPVPVAGLNNQLKKVCTALFSTYASPSHCGSAVTNGYFLSEVELLN